MRALLVVFEVVALMFCVNVIEAQVTYEGCVDFRGQPVASVLDYSINDVAIAVIENGQAVIRYNPNVLAQMRPATRRFFYVHECAHHALGHTISRGSLAKERAADHWAINTMNTSMGLSKADLRTIQEDIAMMSQGDWTHLPGPQRAIDIENGLAGVNNAKTKVPCRHRIPCQHRIPCNHPQHPFDTQHQFDSDYYGNRYPCVHQIPCSHTMHQYDTGHQFDTEHDYDLQ